jgi:APA family basic amino acid/polyamine antiporter
LYAREAFGRIVGIEVGFLLLTLKIAVAAAGADLFADYLVELWPAAQEPAIRLAVLTLLIGFLAALNVYGVKAGASANNFFTVAKLAPLIFFAVAGGVFVLVHRSSVPAATPRAGSFPMRNWFEAAIILTFPFGGFEGAVIPMAEAKNPRRDIPFALFAGMATVTLVYCTIQYVVVSVLPDAAATTRPLAAAAKQLWGTTGASLISLGALISVYGYLTAMMLHSPRLIFALGERGDFPRFFARIHRRFHTPYISILAFAAILWCLAVAGSFRWNVIVSAVGRLLVYGFTCAALPVLRRRHPNAQAFCLPGGDVLAVVGVVLVGMLAAQLTHVEEAIVTAAVALALSNRLWQRERAN